MIAIAVNAIKLLVMTIYIAASGVRLPTMQATHVSRLSSSNSSSSSCCCTTTNVMNGCSSSSSNDAC